MRVLGKTRGGQNGIAVGVYTPTKARREKLSTDRFQIRKLALLVTKANKVLAINTETGGIVWSHFSPNLSPDSLKRLFVTRNTGAHAECALLITKEGKSSMVTLDAHTGTVLESEASLGFRALHAILMPDTDPSTNRRPVMVISADSHHVVAYPSNAFSTEALKERSASIHWHQVDTAANTIQGYRVVKKGDQLASEATWSQAFPAHEKIDEFKARSVEDSIFSPFHVTPTHDVLYKYLNPNTLAVSTVSSEAPFFKGSKGSAQQADSVHLYLIDTVTGGVMYHVAHPASTGPTHLALSENWVVHTYWSKRNLRTELSVLELWEDSGPAQDTITVMLEGMGFGAGAERKLNTWVKRKHFHEGRGADETNEGKTFSSYTDGEPQKEEQSFTFPMAVKSLAVSSTELGISSKDLLVGTASNQLYAMPRKFFDARRPLGQPTQEEAEEGIMQYHPVLPLIPQQMLSYNRTIAGLHSIKAVPAGGFESTSLVLAYGIDLFFTRSAPSKTFDMLPEDFDYGFLIMTTGGLGVAAVAALMASKRNDVNMLWR